MNLARGSMEAAGPLEGHFQVVNGDRKGESTEPKTVDPRVLSLALKAMGEVREQISLELALFRTAYSVQEAEKFMKVVLQVVGEVNEDARKEIVRRLNHERLVHEAVHFTDGIV
jgi:hypothetical protein